MLSFHAECQVFSKENKSACNQMPRLFEYCISFIIACSKEKTVTAQKTQQVAAQRGVNLSLGPQLHKEKDSFSVYSFK